MTLARLMVSPLMIGRPTLADGSRANTSLNSAYVAGVSGAGIAIRYMAQTTDTIDELYIFMDAVTGTLGNVTMQCDIYNELSGNATRAGTTLRDSSTTTTMPAAADMWIKFAFATPYTPAVGEILWLVCYNTAIVPATDFPQILSATTTALYTTIIGNFAGTGYTTTNGFSGTGGLVTEVPFVIKQGSNYFGQPFTQSLAAPYASNTRERGIQFTAPVDCKFNIVAFASSSTSFSDVKLYADATAPGGATLASLSLQGDANQTINDIAQAKVFTAISLTGGTTYKLVLALSGALTTPIALQIEDYASYTTVFDALRGNNQFGLPWSAQDDGAGGWTIDKSLLPGLWAFISELTLAVGGGGDGIAVLTDGGLVR